MPECRSCHVVSDEPAVSQEAAQPRRGRTSAERYGWLRQSRTLLMDAYWPPFNPRLEYDARHLAEICRDLHADTVRFGTAGKYGLIQHPVMPPHPELGDRDLLRETLDALEPLGVKTVAYVPVSHGLPRSLLAQQRPQWALRLDDGTLPAGVQHFGGEPLAPCCPFGAYREDILAFIRSVVHDYAVHGLYLDGPYHDWNMGGPLEICQCEVCRRQYRQATGETLPTNADLAANRPDLAQRLTVFRDWVGQGLLDLLRAINAIAKERDLPVLFNAYASGARPVRFESDMLDEADGFLLEAELGGLKGLGVARQRGKIAWRYTQPHTAWPRLSTPRREQENALCGWETILWGGAPIVSYAGRFCYDLAHAAPLREQFALLEKNADVLRQAEPVRHVGILSLQRMGTTDREAQASLEGVYTALAGTGRQAGIVPRAELDDPQALSDWPVLLAPSLADLTERECDHLRQYVRHGGALVATGTTSLQGDSLLLGDVLGVRLSSPAETLGRRQALRFFEGDWDTYFRIADETLSARIDVTTDDLLPQAGALGVEARPGAKVLAWLIGGDDVADPLGPAIVRQAYDKGCCAYVGFALERLFPATGEDALGRLLVALVDLVAPQQPPYSLQTTRGRLETELHASEKAMLLHCLYRHGTTAVDAAIRFPPGRKVTGVRALRDGRPLSHCVQDGAVRVSDIVVAPYECVCIDLEEI